MGLFWGCGTKKKKKAASQFVPAGSRVDDRPTSTATQPVAAATPPPVPAAKRHTSVQCELPWDGCDVGWAGARLAAGERLQISRVGSEADSSNDAAVQCCLPLGLGDIGFAFMPPKALHAANSSDAASIPIAASAVGGTESQHASTNGCGRGTIGWQQRVNVQHHVAVALGAPNALAGQKDREQGGGQGVSNRGGVRRQQQLPPPQHESQGAAAARALVDGMCAEMGVGKDASRRPRVELAIRQLVELDGTGAHLTAVFEQAIQRWREDPLTAPPLNWSSGLGEQFCHLAQLKHAELHMDYDA